MSTWQMLMIVLCRERMPRALLSVRTDKTRPKQHDRTLLGGGGSVMCFSGHWQLLGFVRLVGFRLEVIHLCMNAP